MFKTVKVVALLMALTVGGIGLASEAKTVDKPKTVAAETAGQALEKVNVNSATADDLTKVKGLGAKKAAAIVAYRNEHGKFQSMEDLTKVKGIGDKLGAKIADQITF